MGSSVAGGGAVVESAGGVRRQEEEEELLASCLCWNGRELQGLVLPLSLSYRHLLIFIARAIRESSSR